jgi:glycosyltransferase involved in cell wall biosynthesis
MKVVCFGPGPQFKGGISNYNTSLAKAFDRVEGCETHIVSWTQQYPAIIPREFVDKSSKTDLLDGTDIQVKYITNYNKPVTWRETVNYIKTLNPDMVIFQWSIAVQGIPLGWIARKLKKESNIEVIFDLHFVIQKENSKLDRILTRYGITKADTYIVHALKTHRELVELFPKKSLHLTEKGERAETTAQTVIKLYHPVYDLFRPNPDFNVAAFKEEHGLKENVFLFFGFIRKYKGLHNVIRAFRLLANERNDVSLLVCGESFWQTLDNTKWSTKVKNFLFGIAKSIFLRKQDDERDYRPLELIEELDLSDETMIVNEFVANEDVHKYFQVSDAIVLYYLTATPSGVESLSYNFKLPVLATRVGHFPETIEDGFNGYLAEPEDIRSMANLMHRFLDEPIDRDNVAKSAKEMSWDNYVKAISNRSFEGN